MIKLRIITVLVLSFCIISVSFAQKKKKDLKDAEPAFKLETQLDSVSYGLGVYLAGSLKQQGFGQISISKFSQGIKDAQESQKTIFDDKAANEIISRYIMGQRKVKAEKNLAEGRLFLEKNKTLPGVITLPSGLQYIVLKEGTGSKPALEDKVTVNYHGTLIDGKVFDSSVDRGQPIQLNVNRVIDGWKEALPLMSTGSKWKLFIPSELGYGENPTPGGPIESNSVLIFEVELISIDKDQPEVQKQLQPENTTKPN